MVRALICLDYLDAAGGMGSTDSIQSIGMMDSPLLLRKGLLTFYAYPVMLRVLYCNREVKMRTVCQNGLP